MREIKPEQINKNLIDLIANEKMLITAGDQSEYNMMTASWGFFGEMWNAPAAMIVVRPQRHTRKFLENNDIFTLTFFGDMPEIYRICGTMSGRDVDKAALAGLTPIFDGGGVSFKEARMTVVCRKKYVGRMDESNFCSSDPLRWYPEKDYHDMLIGTIEKVLINE